MKSVYSAVRTGDLNNIGTFVFKELNQDTNGDWSKAEHIDTRAN
jgi:hypothetical protein